MLRQLSITDLICAVQKRIEDCTGMRCYDFTPPDSPSPLYFVEFTGSEPSNSKTTYRTAYNILIHCISDVADSSVPILKMIQDVEETMTEDIELPSDFDLIMQTYNGVSALYNETQTNEKHAVMSFRFLVGYGFMTKD